MSDQQLGYKSSSSVSKQPKFSKKYIVPVLLGTVVLAAMIFGGIKLLGNKKPAENTTASTPQTEQIASDDASENDVPDTDKTSAYENGFLGIKLTHPETWIATESETQDSVRLESPAFNYLTTDSKDVSGNFRIYVRKGARPADSKFIGRGVALQPSEKLTYTKPAVGQRTETNLTLFGIDTSDNFALFLIAGNYSLNKGDTLGPNYGKEAETYIIGGGFSSKELKDDLATNAVAPELLKSSNAYKQALEILKSLQLR